MAPEAVQGPDDLAQAMDTLRKALDLPASKNDPHNSPARKSSGNPWASSEPQPRQDQNAGASPQQPIPTQPEPTQHDDLFDRDGRPIILSVPKPYTAKEVLHVAVPSDWRGEVQGLKLNLARGEGAFLTNAVTIVPKAAAVVVTRAAAALIHKTDPDVKAKERTRNRRKAELKKERTTEEKIKAGERIINRQRVGLGVATEHLKNIVAEYEGPIIKRRPKPVKVADGKTAQADFLNDAAAALQVLEDIPAKKVLKKAETGGFGTKEGTQLGVGLAAEDSMREAQSALAEELVKILDQVLGSAGSSGITQRVTSKHIQLSGTVRQAVLKNYPLSVEQSVDLVTEGDLGMELQEQLTNQIKTALIDAPTLVTDSSLRKKLDKEGIDPDLAYAQACIVSAASDPLIQTYNRLQESDYLNRFWPALQADPELGAATRHGEGSASIIQMSDVEALIGHRLDKFQTAHRRKLLDRLIEFQRQIGEREDPIVLETISMDDVLTYLCGERVNETPGEEDNRRKVLDTYKKEFDNSWDGSDVAAKFGGLAAARALRCRLRRHGRTESSMQTFTQYLLELKDPETGAELSSEGKIERLMRLAGGSDTEARVARTMLRTLLTRVQTGKIGDTLIDGLTDAATPGTDGELSGEDESLYHVKVSKAMPPKSQTLLVQLVSTPGAAEVLATIGKYGIQGENSRVLSRLMERTPKSIEVLNSCLDLEFPTEPRSRNTELADLLVPAVLQGTSLLPKATTAPSARKLLPVLLMRGKASDGASVVEKYETSLLRPRAAQILSAPPNEQVIRTTFEVEGLAQFLQMTKGDDVIDPLIISHAKLVNLLLTTQVRNLRNPDEFKNAVGEYGASLTAALIEDLPDSLIHLLISQVTNTVADVKEERKNPLALEPEVLDIYTTALEKVTRSGVMTEAGKRVTWEIGRAIKTVMNQIEEGIINSAETEYEGKQLTDMLTRVSKLVTSLPKTPYFGKDQFVIPLTGSGDISLQSTTTLDALTYSGPRYNEQIEELGLPIDPDPPLYATDAAFALVGPLKHLLANQLVRDHSTEVQSEDLGRLRRDAEYLAEATDATSKELRQSGSIRERLGKLGETLQSQLNFSTALSETALAYVQFLAILLTNVGLPSITDVVPEGETKKDFIYGVRNPKKLPNAPRMDIFESDLSVKGKTVLDELRSLFPPGAVQMQPGVLRDLRLALIKKGVVLADT